MGVAPLPRTSTLFLMRGMLDKPDVDLAVGLGRLHLTPKEKKEKIMALQFIKRSELPVVARGKVSTEPAASISEMGRIVFNKLASDWLKEQKAVQILMGYDADKGKMYGWPIKAGEPIPFKMGPEDAMVLGYGTDDKTKAQLGPEDKEAGKSGTGVQNSAPLLRTLDYRFKTSGNHSFKVEMREVSKRQAIVFDLPVGDKSPVAKPKAERAARAPKAPKVMAAVAGASTAPGAEDDMDLS